MRELGPDIRWVQSYVTADKFYCVYNAHSEETIREHAQRGEFPADAVNEVPTVLDPTSAESRPGA